MQTAEMHQSQAMTGMHREELRVLYEKEKISKKLNWNDKKLTILHGILGTEALF